MWQAPHFRKVKYRFRGRRALPQGQVQISWRGQHFRKVEYRFRDRGSAFARSSTDFVAEAALLRG